MKKKKKKRVGKCIRIGKQVPSDSWSFFLLILNTKVSLSAATIGLHFCIFMTILESCKKNRDWETYESMAGPFRRMTMSPLLRYHFFKISASSAMITNLYAIFFSIFNRRHGLLLNIQETIILKNGAGLPWQCASVLITGAAHFLVENVGSASCPAFIVGLVQIGASRLSCSILPFFFL